MPDPVIGPPRPVSQFKQLFDNPVTMRVIQMIVAAGLGAAAGGTSFQVAEGQHNVVVEDNREKLEALKQEIRELREGFAQRVKVEEMEREEAVQRLRDRLIFLETKTGYSFRNRPRELEAAAAAPAPAPERATP